MTNAKPPRKNTSHFNDARKTKMSVQFFLEPELEEIYWEVTEALKIDGKKQLFVTLLKEKHEAIKNEKVERAAKAKQKKATKS